MINAEAFGVPWSVVVSNKKDIQKSVLTKEIESSVKNKSNLEYFLSYAKFELNAKENEKYRCYLKRCIKVFDYLQILFLFSG